LYKKDFENLLRAPGDLPKSLLFFGDSHYYIDTYAKQALEKLPQNSSVLKLYYHEYDFKTALSHLQNGSLFDDANILIVQAEKKIPKKELDELVAACAKNETSWFLLKYLAPDGRDKSKSFGKKNQADFVRFFAPSGYEAVAVLKEHASGIGVKISEHALSHLLALNHNNLELSVNELEKLAIHDDEIDIKTIDKAIQGTAEFDLNDFFNAILNKKNIAHDLEQLLERGEEEVRILTMFQSYVVQLMLFTMAARVNGRIDSKDVLGYKLPPQLEQQRASMAVKFNAKVYHQLLDTLQECEYRIKTSQADKKSALFSTLIKIQTKIV